MPKVIIIGGGVAGMSAAHELIERGFEVQVFERKVMLPGGKARSVTVPDPEAKWVNPLPGEHGFRFFPGFYRHITDTMKRIPFPGNKNGVYDNLVPSPHVMLARFGYKPVILPNSFPRSLKEVKFLIQSVLTADLGLSNEDEDFFAGKVWQLMTSCHERRVNDYERTGWWEFCDADQRGEAYQTLLVQGLTRTLVAARAKTASAKTGGDIFLQLIFNLANPNIATDRVLCGPTNDVWLRPWLDYLVSKGVDYHFKSTIDEIECTNGVITAVWVSHPIPEIPDEVLPPKKYTADYYICCTPVEVAATFMSKAILDADFTLQGIKDLAVSVEWMSGVQFFLNEEVVINRGHIIFSDSPWAITAISQLQFWRNFDISKYADGKVKSIISVDVSDWDTPGIIGKEAKCAKDCKSEEIKREVWEQMKRSLNSNGTVVLRDDMLHTVFIDRDILFEGDYASKNVEPLLVNNVNTWHLRPESHCDIPNLFFASDYVKTNTDLATMEGANEAARRAVNNIIDVSGVKAPFCRIWDLQEPWILAPHRWYDYQRYKKGLGWKGGFPWIVRALRRVMGLFHKM